jgi:hypothetical protein
MAHTERSQPMKKYFPFIAMGILLCCIPAVVYLSFSDHSNEVIGSSFPSSSLPKGTSGKIEKQAGEYLVQAEPLHSPLKTGKQHLNLFITQNAKPVGNLPHVAVTMPMGTSTMTAPVEVQKVSPAGTYEMATDFSMAGEWVIEVIPAFGIDPIKLIVNVQQ